MFDIRADLFIHLLLPKELRNQFDIIGQIEWPIKVFCVNNYQVFSRGLQLIFDDLLQDKNPDPIGRLTHCSITDCSAMDDEAGPSTDGQAFDSSSVQPVNTLNEIQCPLCDFR